MQAAITISAGRLVRNGTHRARQDPMEHPDPAARVEADQRLQQLAELYWPRVLRTAYQIVGQPEEAQDIAQEVFLRLLKHQDHVEGDPAAWLYRVTANLCNDYFRRKRHVVAIASGGDEETLWDPPDPAPGTEDRLAEASDADQRRRWLEAGLRCLSERERTAIVLRDIEGLTTREVAGILGVEEVTVRSQISLARVKLAKFVQRRKAGSQAQGQA